MFRIVIVEDSPSQLDLLQRVLAVEPDFEVAGAYADSESALAEAAWEAVDILLADLELPGMPGVQLIEHARSANAGLLIMAHTIHADRDIVFAALEAGAVGYLLKGGPAARVVEAVRQLARGESPISPAIARHLIERFEPRPNEDLSSREETLLRLVAEGRIYKEIGAQLGISQHTVHAHVQNIYRKLHAGNRSDALRRARLLGYVKSRAAE